MSIVTQALASETVGTVVGGFNTTRVCQNSSCSDCGILNMKPTLNANTPGATAVIISDTSITGHMWGDEIGWVTIAPTGSGVTVNPTTGVVTGKAFANVGSWINFSPSTVGGGTAVGVIINAQGEFTGWAYVSGIHGGWVQFDCAVPATCIKTDWRPLPNRTVVSGGGGGGGGSGGGGGGIFGGAITTHNNVAGSGAQKSEEEKKCSMRQIKPGTRHADVAKIQTFLVSQGYLFAALDSRGYYGSATKASIRAFQNKYPTDIIIPAVLTKPTGNWAFFTAKKAKELGLCLTDTAVADAPLTQTAPPTAQPTACLYKTLEPGLRNNVDVRAMQRMLIRAGYTLVEVTGYYGLTTKQAVAFFQKRYASDILVPLQLKAPTGIWGARSAKKASELGLCK
jgi:peptidoglycan hydrolase-like protein with peptidoglycan-binding domain